MIHLGYIDPIQDPLNFHIELGRDVEWKDLCVSEDIPTNKGHLNQEKVEDWYAEWTKELVRVTKPGKPIIIEQVSLPTCMNWGDWGGVRKTWWHKAVKKYGLNVDVDSIVTKNMHNGKTKGGQRYHVFMEKMR